jgi:hypothetical protein
VLFIGTQFSNLYTAVDTPARGRVVRSLVQLGALKQLTLAWFHGLMQLPDSVVRSIIVALTAASARPLYQEVRRWVWDPETFAPGRSQRRCYPTGRCASVTDLQSFRDCQ